MNGGRWLTEAELAQVRWWDGSVICESVLGEDHPATRIWSESPYGYFPFCDTHGGAL